MTASKTLGRRYPKPLLPNVPNPLCTKAFLAEMLGCEGHLPQSYDGTTSDINSSSQSVGFGLPVRRERTRSPSRRTNYHQGCFI